MANQENRGGGFYDSPFGERRKKRHKKGQTRMNILLIILGILVVVWLLLPNPGQSPPSDPSERTRAFPSTENGAGAVASEAEAAAPLAENASPNPMLEVYIGKELRDGPFRIEIDFPDNEASLSKQEDETHLFRLSGRLYTEEKELETGFRVHFFSNKPEDYEAFQPIFSEDLSFQVEGDHYIFQLSRPEDLDAGLYYYLIEETESGEVHAVRKVSVAVD